MNFNLIKRLTEAATTTLQPILSEKEKEMLINKGYITDTCGFLSVKAINLFKQNKLSTKSGIVSYNFRNLNEIMELEEKEIIKTKVLSNPIKKLKNRRHIVTKVIHENNENFIDIE